ncbi:MAG: response regulator [Planctomycetes bacterium]|nr:response regulator [Planctomycetota bacterium]
MSLKVLICDADDRFVDRATDFLSRHGHQVLTEPLAEEVYGVVKSWRPDVLVLASEAVYPDGGVVLKRIGQLPHRPAVLLTGQLDRFDAAWRAWRQGGDELLLKPILHTWELHTAIISAIECATPKVATESATATA